MRTACEKASCGIPGCTSTKPPKASPAHTRAGGSWCVSGARGGNEWSLAFNNSSASRCLWSERDCSPSVALRVLRRRSRSRPRLRGVSASDLVRRGLCRLLLRVRDLDRAGESRSTWERVRRRSRFRSLRRRLLLRERPSSRLGSRLFRCPPFGILSARAFGSQNATRNVAEPPAHTNDRSRVSKS